jgi:hypothetical protein
MTISFPVNETLHIDSSESFVFQSPVSKNLKIKICKGTVLLDVLYGFDPWSLFENRALRIPKRGEGGENCIIRSFTICILHQILLE